MELDVRRVGIQSCFVALPHSVLEILLSSTRLPSFPVVIELKSVNKSVKSAPFFVAWDGAASTSSHVEIPEALADCIGLPAGARVQVRARGDVATAETVVVEPASEDDWEILELNAEYLENHILTKVGVLNEGQQFPVWVAGNVVLRLRVISTSPKGIVRLVPGAELIVAPKKRQSMPAARSDVADTSTVDDMSPVPVREAWLRVQELDSSVVQTLELGGLTCSTTPSTTVFISPNSAKAILFEDGQLVVISTGKNGTQMPSSKQKMDRGAPGHDALSFLEDEDASEWDEESQHRDAVVRLRFRDDVATGHLMVAFPLRVFVGATVHMSIQLRGVSAINVVKPSTLILSPVLFRPAEQTEFSGAESSDDLDARQFLQQEKVERHSIEGPQMRWQGHRYLLNAATGVNIENPVKTKRQNLDLSSLLLSWWDAQVNLFGVSSSGQVVEDLPISSEAIVHIRIGHFPDQVNQNKRQESYKFASSSMPEVFLPMGQRSHGRAKNFLFRLSTSSGKDSLQNERERRQNSKKMPIGSKASPKFFLLRKESIVTKLASASESQGKVKDVQLTIQQGPPCHLSCITEMTSEAIKGPALKSLNWLEGPASEALARLEVLLSPTLRNRLKLLGTPLPGSVLLYGPQACGKTQLALALARELQDNTRVLSHRVLLQCSELVGRQASVIRKVLRDTLREAMQLAPSLIILDDLDVLLPADASDGPDPGVAVLSIAEFLADLIDICQGRRSNEFPRAAVAFLGVAKSPTSIPACLCFSGRLDYYVQLAAPAATERAAILSQVVRSRGLTCLESVAVEAAANCDGADSMDLEILVDRAVHAAASRFLSSALEKLPSEVATTGHYQGHLMDADSEYDKALPITKKRTFELRDEDFNVALKEFVPLAMRGITKVGTQASIGWEDVGGLYDTQAALQEMLEMPVKYSKIFAQAPLRLRTGVLLYGPPGCGKTHIVGAAAVACSLRLISVKGPELLNKYIGASEQGVRDVFARATAAAPCILFFDEFDAIAPQRGHDNTGVTDRVVNQLLTELDGVEALNGVFVFAATSRPDLLDAALLRPGRLDRLLLCDFPSSRERYDILQVLARKIPLADDVDLEQVASSTEGFSAADLLAVLSDAQLESVHAFLETNEVRVEEGKPIITMSQLQETVVKTRPSVPDAERKRLYGIYDAFMGAKRSISSKRDGKGKRATLA